jgi:hypothetical protein
MHVSFNASIVKLLKEKFSAGTTLVLKVSRGKNNVEIMESCSQILDFQDKSVVIINKGKVL